MGHIVLAAPPIARFHLLERYARECTARGHRVTALCLDPVSFTFWSAQGMSARAVRQARPGRTSAPLEEIASADCLLSGSQPAGKPLRKAVARLERLLPELTRFFESEQVDLVLFHQDRSSAHRLVHFVATQHGARTLWTGDGLLPATMQFDGEGLDGESRTCRRSAWDFRNLDIDDDLLTSTLASVVAQNKPTPLSRRMLQAPPLNARLRDALGALGGRHSFGFFGALDAWHRAAPPIARPAMTTPRLPSRPYLAVLLQRGDEDRIRLDSTGAPTPAELLRAASRSARSIEPTMPVVAVLPAAGLPARTVSALADMDGVFVEDHEATVDACLTAAAVISVNSAAGAVGLLAGTPTLHLGSSIYGISGIATRFSLEQPGRSVRAALDEQQPELVRRFLTWMLNYGHLWCSSEQPDHNGLSGLILESERRLPLRSPFGMDLSYRSGPAWPLTT